jgi:hypothetical protein
MESATIRCSYPETQKILNARRNKHPSEDEISDAGYAASWAASKQAEAAAAAPAEGSKEKPSLADCGIPVFAERRSEQVMHKSLSSKRSVGGKFYTIGGVRLAPASAASLRARALPMDTHRSPVCAGRRWRLRLPDHLTTLCLCCGSMDGMIS